MVEDHLRFVLRDPLLADQAKRLRHDLAKAIQQLDIRARYQARNAVADVGRHLETEAEYERSGPAAVARANLGRIPQALRCLEEYGKLLDSSFARQIEQLRYDVYELERLVMLVLTRPAQLRDARLYVLVDAADSLEQFTRRIEPLLAAGVHVLQLRDKRRSDRDLQQRAARLCEMTRGTKTLAIMNDRADLACLVQADGVHVGQEDLPASDLRRVLSATSLVGVSTHSLEQAQQAVLDGADYLGVGPTFPSQTKDFASFPGVALLAQIRRKIGLPAFAIGGITLERLPAVRATGFDRVAVSSAIWGHPDATSQAQEFLRQLTPPANPNSADGAPKTMESER